MKDFLAVALAIALAGAPISVLAKAVGVDTARVAAAAWLDKLDAADCAATWAGAAAMFQSAVSVQSWQQAAQSVRQPLGALKVRTEK